MSEEAVKQIGHGTASGKVIVEMDYDVFMYLRDLTDIHGTVKRLAHLDALLAFAAPSVAKGTDS